jgi:hypothetical protein
MKRGRLRLNTTDFNSLKKWKKPNTKTNITKFRLHHLTSKVEAALLLPPPAVLQLEDERRYCTDCTVATVCCR